MGRGPVVLSPGDTGEASLVVQEQDTARALALDAGDSFPAVFATSRMVALMELAAARALKPLLGPGELSVGVVVNVRHTAATPVGVRVRAVATYLGTGDRLHRFRIEAFDAAGPIGEGEHSRAVIGVERLVKGAERRRQGAG